MKNWKTYIKEQLAVTRLLKLQTISENISWSSPTYFVCDDNLNTYILLDTISQHMKNLTFFPKALVSLEYSEVVSNTIQMIGTVKILQKKDIPSAIYHQLYQYHTGDIQSLEQSAVLDWRFAKIAPEHIFIVNIQNPDDRQEIYLEKPLTNFPLN